MKLLENYKVLTVTHQSINVDEIGNFVIKNNSNEELQSKINSLKAECGIEEIIYLSTCNRVTYICYSNEEFTTELIQKFFLNINPDLAQSQVSHIHKFIDFYQGLDAIQHLYEVAASMDSLVVGEREIFRQFREAYHKAVELKYSGDYLRLLEKSMVKAAKDVYAKTKIGEKPLSIVSLAIQALLQKDIKIEDRILLVGAGETNTLVAKFLKKYGYTNVVVFNRSLDNAQHLVELLDAKAYHLSKLKDYSEDFKALIVCTAATEPIITVPIFKAILKNRDEQKLVIDLSVPNNVAPEVVSNFDIDYVDIEKLRALANANLELRRKEFKSARIILRTHLELFKNMLQQRELEKALGHIPQEIKEVKQRARDLVYKKEIDALDHSTQELIHEIMNYMEKKCISIPMKAAKKMVSPS